MSSELSIRCPVCRAQQTLTESCRSCRADLRLVQKAYHRLEFLRSEWSKAMADSNEPRAKAILAEIRWLAPSSAPKM